MIQVLLPGAQFPGTLQSRQFGLMSCSPGTTRLPLRMGVLACYRSQDILDPVNSGR